MEETRKGKKAKEPKIEMKGKGEFEIKVKTGDIDFWKL